jgi:isoleucyl-tRNA synthetase
LNYPISLSLKFPESGWTVASHEGESVALDLKMSDALIEAGLVREVIRALQEQRKSEGFEISDRIRVLWNADEATARAVNNAINHIQSEVLALSMERKSEISFDSELELGCTVAKSVSL